MVGSALFVLFLLTLVTLANIGKDEATPQPSPGPSSTLAPQ